MSYFKKIPVVFAALGAAAFLAGCGGDGADSESDQPKEEKVSLSVGTTNTSSSLYAYYSGLNKALSEYAPEVSLTILETGATIDNITRLERGQIDMGLAVMDGAYEAYEGSGKWEDDPQKNLRTLYVYTENALYYVVTQDSGVTEFSDFDGQKYNLGIRGSTTENQTTDIFALLDIDVSPHTGDVSDAANAVKDGDIIGLTKTGVGTSPDATIMDLETSKDLHLLGYSEEEVEKIQETFPWLRTTTIPADIYDWQETDVTTLAQQVGNIVLSDLPEEVAYKITKAAFEGKNYQEEAYSSIKDLDFVELTLDSPIPLHAGTVRYLEEIGIDVPSELIPEEYKKD